MKPTFLVSIYLKVLNSHHASPDDADDDDGDDDDAWVFGAGLVEAERVGIGAYPVRAYPVRAYPVRAYPVRAYPVRVGEIALGAGRAFENRNLAIGAAVGGRVAEETLVERGNSARTVEAMENSESRH
jgi:hypothetical protein